MDQAIDPLPASHSALPITFPEDEAGSVRVHSGSGFRFVVPFPYRLHQILDQMDKAGDTSIICWQPDGRHFVVVNPTLLMKEIIPKFFNQNSFKSFQRQLHLYGFQRVDASPNQGSYYHENFIKGNRNLCLKIKRIKAPLRRRLSERQKERNIEEETFLPSADTITWLISAGIPISDLDPFPIDSVRYFERDYLSVLNACADEILSVFK